MKIAFILSSLSNTGPEIVAFDLCSWLVAKGHTCKVFYFNEHHGLTFPCETVKINFFKSFDFKKWDIVHTHTIKPDLFVRLHTLFGRHRNTPKFVSTLHNPISLKYERQTFRKFLRALILHPLWQLGLKRHDKIVVLNDELKKDTQRLIPIHSSKVVTIHNGRTVKLNDTIRNENDLVEIKKLKSKYTLIGTVSGINIRKGLSQLITALTELPDFAYIAVGDGPELENLKALATSLNVADRCYFTGYRKDATDYFSVFDIFCMCSYSEGFPLALIEASAYGLPTVLSDINVLTSLIGPEEVAFYELGNSVSLAKKIRQVQSNRESYSIAIKKYYDQNLTLDHMGENYLSLYNKILMLKTRT